MSHHIFECFFSTFETVLISLSTSLYWTVTVTVCLTSRFSFTMLNNYIIIQCLIQCMDSVYINNFDSYTLTSFCSFGIYLIRWNGIESHIYDFYNSILDNILFTFKSYWCNMWKFFFNARRKIAIDVSSASLKC